MIKEIEIRDFYDEEELIAVASLESFGRIPVRSEEIVMGTGDSKKVLVVNRVVHGDTKVILYVTMV